MARQSLAGRDAGDRRCVGSWQEVPGPPRAERHRSVRIELSLQPAELPLREPDRRRGIPFRIRSTPAAPAEALNVPSTLPYGHAATVRSTPAEVAPQEPDPPQPVSTPRTR